MKLAHLELAILHQNTDEVSNTLDMAHGGFMTQTMCPQGDGDTWTRGIELMETSDLRCTN